MTFSVTLALVLAVLLFWALGAYNRLMRLRFKLRQIFAALAVPLGEYIELTQVCAPAALPRHEEGDGEPGGGPAGDDGAGALWVRLQAAAAQYGAALVLARAKPLDAATLAALVTAHEVLQMTWQRLVAEAQDLAGSAVPEDLQMRWRETTVRADELRATFNRSMQLYNHAVGQFPASLLAWLFGFAAANTL